jgi:miniconductance mechanosensitive channel
MMDYIKNYITICASQPTPLILLGLILASLLIFLLVRLLALRVIHAFIRKSSNAWDDIIVDTGLLKTLSWLVPLVVFNAGVLYLFPKQGWTAAVRHFTFAAIILVGTTAASRFLDTVEKMYSNFAVSKRRPIRGYVQAVKIIMFVFAAIFVTAHILGKSPWGMMSVLGGLTAVIMLVFKDTILGFVAGIQLSAYDMVRIGDWIEVPEYHADGDVLDVNVNTIKVQNWDKTITTIPTYALVSGSFKNWRGMSESEGRRIKRSVFIDMQTIRFCDDKMLEQFRNMDILRDYINKREEEIESANRKADINLNAVINGRHQTNIGVFRAYLVSYLRHHRQIHDGMTFLVRQLQPTPKGLPIEIYVFSTDKTWVNYENIQSDIFDHILASIPEFGLRVFQDPSGTDICSLSTLTTKIDQT